MTNVSQIAQQAKQASVALALFGQTAKNQALLTIADSLESRAAEIYKQTKKTLNLRNHKAFQLPLSTAYCSPKAA